MLKRISVATGQRGEGEAAPSLLGMGFEISADPGSFLEGSTSAYPYVVCGLTLIVHFSSS